MKCKFKNTSNERLCEVMNGECQFLECCYGPDCPIYQAYPDWDKCIAKSEDDESDD